MSSTNPTFSANSNHKTYIPASAMAIHAHPDDHEFSCAGTLARWARAGTRTCLVVVTSGDVGIADTSLTREQVIEIREAEQREAAQITGVTEVVFLREPDGMVVPSLDLRRKLVREIRRFRPEVVICGDPTVVWAGENYINHPDHRAVATASIDAIFPAAGQPHLFEDLAAEGLRAHKVRKVFVETWQGPADFYVNIDDTIDVKIAALRAHKSQMQDWDPEPRMREWAAQAAKGKEMRYAEAFRVVTLVSDEDYEKMLQKATEATVG
jgi:LmbE family N-acetylglucosaminyl deacetylase